MNRRQLILALLLACPVCLPAAPAPLPRRDRGGMTHFTPGRYLLSSGSLDSVVEFHRDHSYRQSPRSETEFSYFGTWSWDGRTLKIRRRHWLDVDGPYLHLVVNLDRKLCGVSTEGVRIKLRRLAGPLTAR